MKILLDENLPVKLRSHIARQHQVHAVRDMGWLGKKNGELLGLMILEGFDGFVTLDKNLRHQQNLDRFPILIFILDAPDNRIDTLEPFIARLNVLLDAPSVAQVTVVELSDGV